MPLDLLMVLVLAALGILSFAYVEALDRLG